MDPADLEDLAGLAGPVLLVGLAGPVNPVDPVGLVDLEIPAGLVGLADPVVLGGLDILAGPAGRRGPVRGTAGADTIAADTLLHNTVDTTFSSSKHYIFLCVTCTRGTMC